MNTSKKFFGAALIFVFMAVVAAGLLLGLGIMEGWAISFGPGVAVDEQVEQTDDKANDHWQSTWERNCEGEDWDCRNVPDHVHVYWDNNPGNAPDGYPTTKPKQNNYEESTAPRTFVKIDEPMKENNDGSGVRGSIDLGSFRGTGEIDIAASGADEDGKERLVLYGNGSDGKFTKSGEPMTGDGEGVQDSSITLEEVTGDKHLDLIVTGEDDNNNPRLVVYKNDGLGNFSKNFEPTKNTNDGTGIRDGSIATADFTGDGIPDLAVVGRDPSLSIRLILLKNDGSGTFTLHSEPMTGDGDGVLHGSIKFADFTGNGHPDLAIAGRSPSRRLVIYENDGSGNFSKGSEPMAGNGEGLRDAAINAADFDGDGDQDLAVTGTDDSFSERFILFTNDGSGNFSKHAEPMTGDGGGIERGSVEFADFTNDGYPDLAVSGLDKNTNARLILYKNDGSGNFTKHSEPMLEDVDGLGVSDGSLKFADITNNDYLDLVVSGSSSGDRRLVVYENQPDL